MAWNRARRESGAAGIAAAAFVVAVVAFALLPPVLGSMLVGHALGSVLDDPEGGEALRGAASFHAFLVWFFGLIGVLGPGRPRFTDPRFRVYPIPRRALLTAELCGSLLDFVPLLGVGCFAGFLAGIAVARPAIAVLAAPLIAAGALSLLLVYQASGVAQRVLLKRPRVALGLLAILSPALVLAWVAAEPGSGLELLRHLLERFVSLQPSTSAWMLLHEHLAGEPASDAVLGRALALPVAIGLGAALVVRLLVLEADLEPAHLRRAGSGARERLWSFDRPAAGIARLFAIQVLGQARGRFLVFAPPIGATALAVGARVFPSILPELVKVPGPFRSMVDIGSYPLVAWFPAVTLALSADLWANQFGGDGHGIKTLFGLPVPMREIVLGKLLGIGRIALLQTVLSLPALALLGSPGVGDLVHGLAAGAVGLLVLGSLGMLISARFPHRATGGEGEARPTPLVRLLLPMGAILMMVQLLIGTELLARSLHPLAPPLSMVLLLLAVLAAYRASLPVLVSRVEAEQERLVEELG